jgi:hypothetical protein
MIARTPPRRRAHHPHGELRERLGNYLSVRPLHVGNYLSADRKRTIAGLPLQQQHHPLPDRARTRRPETADPLPTPAAE